MKTKIFLIYIDHINNKLKSNKIILLNLLLITLFNVVLDSGFCLHEEKNLNIVNHYIKTAVKSTRDPTMPNKYVGHNQLKNNSLENDIEDKSPLKLTMIVIKDVDKTVTINNQILREDEQIEGYKILQIKEDKVLLQDLNNNEQIYNKLKSLSSNIKVRENSKKERFVELSLPKITIKEPVE